MSNMSFPCIHYLLYFDIDYIYSWNDTPSFTLRAYFLIQLNAMGKHLSMFLHLAPSLFINLPHPHAHISLRVANYMYNVTYAWKVRDDLLYLKYV